MALQSVGSIFKMTPTQVKFYTEQRLWPQDKRPQSLWGCSSLTGFLAPEQGLLECGRRDFKTLNKKKVTYYTIAERLRYFFKSALETKSGTIIIEGKFKVKLEERTACSQFCPFSPVSDDNADPFESIDGACGESNRDFTVTHIPTNKKIKASFLHIHLVGVHHFFEGRGVPYRLSPTSTIKVLEIGPEKDFSSPTEMPAGSVAIQPTQKLKPSWEFTGSYPCNTVDSPSQLAAHYNKELFDFGDGVVGVILFYPHGFDDEPEMGLNRFDLQFLHLFNPHDTEKKVSGTILGVKFFNVPVPPYRRISMINHAWVAHK